MTQTTNPLPGTTFDIPTLFDRETRAGYDTAQISAARIAVIGAGAAGNNILHTLALTGVGEVVIVDPDVVEPSNLTRSPLFRRERMKGGRVRHKAREAALGFLHHSYAERPSARFAIARIETLGLAAFDGCHAVVSAVDSPSARAYLADATRMLGIPLIEVGFQGAQGQFSVYPNSSAEAPCWRCLHPHIEHGSFSCLLYARAMAAQGRLASTQPLASVFGNLAAEAALLAVHGKFPMGDRALFLNIRDGAARTMGLTRDPNCPGAHRVLGPPAPLELTCDATASELFEAVREDTGSLVLRLPSTYLVSAPCERCGAEVRIGRPVGALLGAPACRACPPTPRLGAVATLYASVERGMPVAQERLRRLGLAHATTVELEDAVTGRVLAVRLRGSGDELFTTLRREGALAPASAGADAATASASSESLS